MKVIIKDENEREFELFKEGDEIIIRSKEFIDIKLPLEELFSAVNALY